MKENCNKNLKQFTKSNIQFIYIECENVLTASDSFGIDLSEGFFSELGDWRV